ncbi:MAG: glycine oxidase ThiO [Pyrinomonadaceae bacterium]|nr:glycine oxidase ThiO [Pyrinomonadaceae bacterium]
MARSIKVSGSNPSVLIIGGGVIGLSIARELHLRGVRNITLLERKACGEESSWAAGGMLGPQAEADEAGPFYDLCGGSRDLYPAFADALLAETGIDIELDRSGTLYSAFNIEDERHLNGRFEWQSKAGLAVERLTAEETRRSESFISPDVRMSLLFPNDWQVDNRKLLTALGHYAEMNKIEICENTHVESLLIKDGCVTGAASANRTFTAGKTVLATGAWTSLIKLGDMAMPFAVTPVRGQIICLRTAKRVFEHVVYSRRGYIVPRADGRILAGSTTEFTGFTKGVTGQAATDLRNMAFEIAPSMDNLQVIDSWSGLRPMAADGLPVLGEIECLDSLFVATAHYRNGILLAPLTAKLAADSLIDGQTDIRLSEFSPNRFRVAAGKSNTR